MARPKADKHISGEIVTIYAAVTTTDTIEGRGSQIDHSYYTTEQDAAVGASGIGVMGDDGKVESREALHLADGRYMLLSAPIKTSEAKTGELRKKALAKLSKAERVALFGCELRNSFFHINTA